MRYRHLFGGFCTALLAGILLLGLALVQQFDSAALKNWLPIDLTGLPTWPR